MGVPVVGQSHRAVRAVAHGLPLQRRRLPSPGPTTAGQPADGVAHRIKGIPMQTHEDIAKQLLGAPYDKLDARTQKVARHVAQRHHIARDTGAANPAGSSRGQRAADAVAAFGGSWRFVGLFAAVMLVWVEAELEIMLLHNKIDTLRQTQWAELLALQQQQLQLLAQLANPGAAAPGGSGLPAAGPLATGAL